jgi:hypothetical protein
MTCPIFPVKMHSSHEISGQTSYTKENIVTRRPKECNQKPGSEGSHLKKEKRIKGKEEAEEQDNSARIIFPLYLCSNGLPAFDNCAKPTCHPI